MDVVHGDDVLLFLHVLAHERVVDGHRAELVLDDGDELAVIALQDVVHQRGLARAEETGDDGHGGLLRVRDVRHVESWGSVTGARRRSCPRGRI